MRLHSWGFVSAVTSGLVLAGASPAYAASEAVEVLVPLGFFVCVIVVAAIVARTYQRYLAEQHQTLRAMVDKGMQIPPHVLELTRRPSPQRDVRRGIFLLCLGVGLAIFLGAEEGPEAAALGLIPAFVGAGYLIVARLERRRAPAEDPATT
jgi:hypothetical protein